MQLDRREFLLASGAGAAAASTAPAAAALENQPWAGQWIWYPGQLAAYRHARRMHLALQRCTMVGYPANYRQPVQQAWFRVAGSAARDIELRWTGPLGRIRVAPGGRGGDITSRKGRLRSGQQGIEVQIDFAASLPCLLLDGAEFSTGPRWEASLDGIHWVPAESGAGSDPLRRPDAEREVHVSLPVHRTVAPEGAPRESYVVGPGRDVVVDFRETELGALKLEARGRGELQIQVGESVAEVRDPDLRFFEQYPLPAVALTAQPASLVMPERAFRFVRLSCSGEAEVRGLQFDASLWPARELGRFESSDPDLNAIWTAGVATLRSNMHDFYLDGIRRDGLIWHDGPLTLEAYERVFFDADLSRQTLIAETLPDRPSVRDLGIIDAPMYTIVGFEREWLARGEAAFSRMFRPRIEDIVRMYEQLQDENGFVDARRVQPYGYFPDWSSDRQSGPDAHGAPAYGQMLLAGMFASAARLAQAWNDDALAARWQSAATRLRQAIRKTFWRPERKLFVNGLDSAGKLDERFSPFAQAFAVAYSTATADDHDGLFRFLDDPALRPAHFSLSQVVELTAYARAGRAAAALSRLRAVWLPMLRQGYRRFFEDVRPTLDPLAQLGMYGRRYANSLCHAWSGAAPVMALSCGVLGIDPLEPGYRVVRVAPQGCGLQWVKGTVPTPGGLIEIEWRDGEGQLSLPAGVTARLAGGGEVAGPGRFPIRVAQSA